MFMYSEWGEVDKTTRKLAYYSFNGFNEAGAHLSQYAGTDTVIFAASNRAMVYYSGINFAEHLGQEGRILKFKWKNEENL